MILANQKLTVQKFSPQVKYLTTGFFLLLIAAVAACYRMEVEVEPTIATRSILENNLGLHKKWRISPVLITSDGLHFAYMTLTSNTIVAEINLLPENEQRLISFTTSTGKIEWEVKDIHFVSAIIADADRVYIAPPGHFLEAYDLKTGKLEWSGPHLRERRAYFLDIRDGILFNYSRGLVQSIDPETGNLLAEDQEQAPTPALLILRSDEFDLRSTATELLKIRRSTSEVVWRTPIESDSGVARLFPVLSNNRLVTIFGRGDLDLYVIDFTTGQVLWKATDFFVSNVAVSAGRLYILDANAKLFVFDEETGIELGYIQFDPASTDTASQNYWVGVDERGQIFVYFSDSQEVFALEPKP